MSCPLPPTTFNSVRGGLDGDALCAVRLSFNRVHYSEKAARFLLLANPAVWRFGRSREFVSAAAERQTAGPVVLKGAYFGRHGAVDCHFIVTETPTLGSLLGPGGEFEYMKNQTGGAKWMGDAVGELIPKKRKIIKGSVVAGGQSFAECMVPSSTPLGFYGSQQDPSVNLGGVFNFKHRVENVLPTPTKTSSFKATDPTVEVQVNVLLQSDRPYYYSIG